MHESLSVCRLNLYPRYLSCLGALVSAGFLVTENHCLLFSGDSAVALSRRGCWRVLGLPSAVLPLQSLWPCFGHKRGLAFLENSRSSLDLLLRSTYSKEFGCSGFWVVHLEAFAVRMLLKELFLFFLFFFF